MNSRLKLYAAISLFAMLPIYSANAAREGKTCIRGNLYERINPVDYPECLTFLPDDTIGFETCLGQSITPPPGYIVGNVHCDYSPHIPENPALCSVTFIGFQEEC